MRPCLPFLFFRYKWWSGTWWLFSFCFVSEYINGKYFRIEAIFCVTKEKQKSTTNGEQASAFQCCLAWIACPKYEQSAWKPFKLSSMYKVYKHCNRLVHPQLAILRSKVSTSISVDFFFRFFFLSKLLELSTHTMIWTFNIFICYSHIMPIDIHMMDSKVMQSKRRCQDVLHVSHYYYCIWKPGTTKRGIKKGTHPCSELFKFDYKTKYDAER